MGTDLRVDSPLGAALTAVSQVNTIDLLILRPTTQYMTTIRSFVTHPYNIKFSGVPAEGQVRGGGAGDKSPLSGPWGLYFNGGGSFGNINTSPGSTGFDINNQLATGGVGYRFSDAIVSGFLFNFTGSQVRSREMPAPSTRTSTGSCPSSASRPLRMRMSTSWPVTAITPTIRRAQVPTPMPQPPTRRIKRSRRFWGYSHAFGALELTGFAGGGYVGTDVNGYEESGQGLLLTVGGYHVSSWTSNLGLQLDYAHSTTFGVVRPQLRMEWVHEFDNQGHAVNVTIPSLGNLALPVSAGQRIGDWGNLTAGVQTIFAHGITGFANYQAQIFSAGENHIVEGGVRVEF